MKTVSLSPATVITLLQLCQNYLLQCVSNGKLRASEAALDAWIHSVDDRWGTDGPTRIS
jgi:hypothetical protein